METKNVLYAAVGAPVVAARKFGDKVHDLRTRLNKGATEYGKAAEKMIDTWAAEGEKVVGRMTDRKMVDELAAKVDLDQAKEQVTKLRDQLEDMLDTWRSSFRPERSPEEATPAPKTTAAPAMKPATKKPVTKKPATKASTAKKPAAKKPAAKTSAAKTTKSTAAKTSSARPEDTPSSQAS